MNPFSTIIPILIISIPVFYISGLITFVRFMVKEIQGKKKQRSKKLESLIVELKKSPSNKNVSDLITSYQIELDQLKSAGVEVKSPQPVVKKEQPVSVEQPPAEPMKPKPTLSSRWMSLGSINILLYIGAFLIVSSAVIFVSFQWESLGGLFKSWFLTGFIGAFLVCGFLFFQSPKIKQAGATFLAIGSILIPFGGLAWYNFHFRGLGADFFLLWLVTSIIALLVYVVGVYYVRTSFYLYFSSFGLFSLVVSVMNLMTDNEAWYFLTAVLSATILQVMRLYFKKQENQENAVRDDPLRISANLIVFLTLLFGFINALDRGIVIFLPFSVSLFSVVLYYGLLYIYSQKTSDLFIALFMLPLNLTVFMSYLKADSLATVYLVNLLAVNYIILSGCLGLLGRKTHKNIPIVFAILYTVIGFFVGMIDNFDPLHLTIFSFVPVIFGVVLNVFHKKAQYLLLSTISLAVAGYYLVYQLFDVTNKLGTLTIFYLIIAIILYFLMILFKEQKNYRTVFLGSTIFYLVLTYTISSSEAPYFLITNLVVALFFFASSFQFLSRPLIYLSNLSLYIALFPLLNLVEAKVDIYPFVFMGLSLGLYLVGMGFVSRDKEYKKTALLAFILIPFLFQSVVSDLSGLISLYLATVFLVLDGWFSQNTVKKYIASVYGLITYFFQVSYLYPKINDAQFYILPLGLYFLGLSFFQKRAGKIQAQRVLNIIGFLIIIIATFSQSMGNGGVYYALLLGIEGVIFLFIGISLQAKDYIRFGITAMVVATISQIYEYIFSLPKWIITGGVGLSFLILAIVLLLKRKE